LIAIGAVNFIEKLFFVIISIAAIWNIIMKDMVFKLRTVRLDKQQFLGSFGIKLIPKFGMHKTKG
jgi:hypothetical protein